MKTTFIAILFCLFASCATKKIKNHTETTHKIDTVYLSKETIKTYEVKDTITVESPCDEKGNLKEFSHSYNTGAGKVQVFSKDNKISFDLYIPEFTSDKTFSYKTKTDKDYKTIENTTKVYRIPFWAWVVILCSVALNVMLFYLWTKN